MVISIALFIDQFEFDIALDEKKKRMIDHEIIVTSNIYIMLILRNIAYVIKHRDYESINFSHVLRNFCSTITRSHRDHPVL